MKDIFLIGKAGSGKDTVAEILEEFYDYRLVAFADDIRAEYTRFFLEKNPRTDRAKLIEIGETYKKLYGTDVWTRLLIQEINVLDNSADYAERFVVTDGRHKIEYDTFVGGLDYVPIFIDCPEEIRYARLLARDGTLQEEALKLECQDLWEAPAFVLDNSGTLEQLKINIEALVDKAIGR